MIQIPVSNCWCSTHGCITWRVGFSNSHPAESWDLKTDGTKTISSPKKIGVISNKKYWSHPFLWFLLLLYESSVFKFLVSLREYVKVCEFSQFGDWSSALFMFLRFRDDFCHIVEDLQLHPSRGGNPWSADVSTRSCKCLISWLRGAAWMSNKHGNMPFLLGFFHVSNWLEILNPSTVMSLWKFQLWWKRCWFSIGNRSYKLGRFHCHVGLTRENSNLRRHMISQTI